MGRYRISADIGGTFTDFVFYDTQTGRFKAGKVLSTPKNRSDAIIKGITEELTDFSEIGFFVHGTTTGLNAVLERKGKRVALVTTKGFKDIYIIARGNKKELYNQRFRKVPPLLSRQDIFEVDERVLWDGAVETSLDAASVRAAAQAIAQGGYDSVAVCLLNSYRNPEHEQQVEEILRPLLPGAAISLSCVVAREWREYERTSTVVMNSYIAPIVKSYLENLEGRMRENGFAETIYIMQSGGGVITTDIAKTVPIQTLLSGPVGGAIGNNCIGDMLGYPNLVGVDMGGTSYDISLVVNGRPDVSTETELEGLPILTPMVNIYTIGAGGGSIAWVQNGGLRVGPISAGSDPGPACYGNGGTRPTITDADVVLGRIDPNGFLGGNMVLDKAAAVEAVAGIAEELGLTVEETADGICKVADAKMADAIRQITVRKGLDPREFVLVAYGGAGPMHACSTAAELGITTILVPEMPGTFSAWGMHQSDIRQDTVRTLTTDIAHVDPAAVAERFREMHAEVSQILRAQNIPDAETVFLMTADLRYNGQDATINVAFPANELTREALDSLRKDFDALHQSIHGHSNPREAVDLVNVRLTGLGRLKRIPKSKETVPTDTPPAPRVVSDVIFHNRAYRTGIYRRETLRYGHTFAGPAIIEELTTTTIVPPDYLVTVDPYNNLLITSTKEAE